MTTIPELEFIGEETLVSIIPRFSHQTLRFISGDVGPFIAQSPINVPLWLAVTLKKKGRCHIQIPEWMQVENLKNTLEEERNNPIFQDLPFQYAEIASILLREAREDIPEAEHIRTLLEDISVLRMHKIQKGLSSISTEVQDGEVVHSVQMNGVSSLEVNSIKPILAEALTRFHSFSKLIPNESRPIPERRRRTRYNQESKEEEEEQQQQEINEEANNISLKDSTQETSRQSKKLRRFR